MRILKRFGRGLSAPEKGHILKQWDECAPCADTVDAALNERLAALVDVDPGVIYADCRVQGYFSDLSEALDLRAHMPLRSDGARPRVSSKPLLIDGACGVRVSEIFQNFFDPERWADMPEAMQEAWQEIPDLAKKMKFRDADGTLLTPASIYRNSLAAVMREVHVPPHEAELYDIADFRAA